MKSVAVVFKTAKLTLRAKSLNKLSITANDNDHKIDWNSIRITLVVNNNPIIDNKNSIKNDKLNWWIKILPV